MRFYGVAFAIALFGCMWVIAAYRNTSDPESGLAMLESDATADITAEYDHTDPEQPESEIILIADRQTAAGRNRETKTASKTITADHSSTADDTQSQIRLRFQWYEINETPTTIAAFGELFAMSDRATKSDDGDSAMKSKTWKSASTTGIVSSKRLLELIDNLSDQGAVTQLVDLTNDDRESRIFNGNAVEAVKSKSKGETVRVASTTNGEFSPPDADILDQGNIQFIGDSLQAIAEIQPDDLVELSLVLLNSEQDDAKRQDGVWALTTKKTETVVGLRAGQSHLLFGPRITRNSVMTQRTPVLSDIPIIGRKYFSKMTIKKETLRLLCVTTPEIVQTTDALELSKEQKISPAIFRSAQSKSDRRSN